MKLSYFIAHAPYTYSLSNLSRKNIAKYAPVYLYGAIYFPEKQKIISFDKVNALSLCEYLKNASHIIGFRGSEFGIPTLRKYFGIKGRIPVKGKHTDIHSHLVKLNGGQNVSLERALFSNSLMKKYERIYNYKGFSELELKQYTDSAARNIYRLFELYKSGNLKLNKTGRKGNTKKRGKKLSTLKNEAILTIELVPETSWFTNVRSQVTKSEWDIIRRKAYKETNYKCAICGGVGNNHPVECHELWEYDDKKHIQTLVGFTALCTSCHEVKHMGFSNARGRGDIALAHLSKINNWSLQETARYVKAQFDKWQERSYHEWSLHLKFLNKIGIKYKKN